MDLLNNLLSHVGLAAASPLALFAFLIVWSLIGGGLWRLGGGAFTTITGLNFGTDPARVIRALVAAVTFLVFPWWTALVAIFAVFIGVCIGGWGPFQGMGLPAPAALEKSWMRWLPELFRFEPNTLPHDFIGMMQAGTVCMLPLAIVLAVLINPAAGTVLAVGPLFAPCYLLARDLVPWSIPKFCTGQEWGEVFVGMVIAAALALIALQMI